MADRRRKQKFPNLKICVENTDESSDNSSSDSESSDSSSETDTTETESSSDTSDNDNDDDVQFRVKIGNVQDRLQVQPKPTESETEERISDTETSDKRTASLKEQSVNASLPAMAPKVYENKAGDFYTGIDMNTKEAQEKVKERAKRFGLESDDNTKDLDFTDLYKSLKIKEDVNKNERGIRLNAVHIRGLENMSTQDVFDYFGIFAPGSIEWIDDFSCNVVWIDPVSASRAMLHMSKSYDEIKEEENHKPKIVTEKSFEKMEEDDEEKKLPSEKDEMKSKESKQDSVQKENSPENIRSEEAMEEDDNLDLTEAQEVVLKPPAEASSVAHPEQSGTSDMTEDNIKYVVGIGTENIKEVPTEEGQKKQVTDFDSPQSPDETPQSDKETNGFQRSVTDKETNGFQDKPTSDTEQDGEHSVIYQKKQKQKVIAVPWPPGYWRLGIGSSKAKFLFLRFATKADKKIPGAERKSRYYQKYGNPNYGGMTGLISGSRKRKLRAKKIHDEIESVKKVVEEKNEAVQKEESLLHDSDEDKRLVDVQESGSTKNVDEGIAPPVDEAELEKLMGPPAKRKMRMYADDIEEEMKKKKTTGGLKIVADARHRLSSRRPVDARQKLQDLRSTNYYDRDQFIDEDDESVDSDNESNHYSSYQGVDLRTKLQRRRNRTSGFSSMKIEISE